MNDQELMHYGILGMKWGVRRYQKKDGSRTPAGKKRYKNDKENNQEETSGKFKLSEKQKKYIKIAAAAVATSLAIYGGYKLYKSGKLDNLLNIGKGKTESLINDNKDILVNGLKKMTSKETLSDTIGKANPLKGTLEGKNNCVPSSIASFMRQKGYNVTAKGTGGEMKNLGGVIEECFKGAKVLDGSATTFGKSKNDAASMLLRRFGENAEGVCSISWKKEYGGGGHAFNWKILNGQVSFFDGNASHDDNFIANQYFKRIDTAGSLFLARLDNAEINFDNIKKYIN